ncbi:MAG TPA: serine/threonine-protein kinase [Kofleriaceae bacterium]|nr:serine/threonine-protein kinase [Kofleriaceae bacterium]
MSGRAPRPTAARLRFRPAQIGAELGRYQLLEELGSGGMATVFRARDRDLRRDVAVKVLFPHLCKNREVVSRFQREARAAAALDHPHILRVFDVGGGAPASEAEGDAVPVDPPYIVLELVRGPSLDQLIDGDPPLAEIVAAIGVALCEALAHAHRAGVIHRDLKPGNVLVAEAGRPVLSDFGVARVLDDESSVVTRTGALLGTPAFMSPEQAAGGDLDARSDLYSLGATLYQLATGSLPVTGSAARAVAQIAAGDVVPPLRRNPRLGPDLARIIERLMRVEPGQRHADAAEVAAALREIVGRAGAGEPDDLLREHFADPASCRARLLPLVVSATVGGARDAAATGQPVRALALADRALALEPGCKEALALVDDIGRGRARRRAGLAALAVAVVGAATWGGMSWWGGATSREVGQGAAGQGTAIDGGAASAAAAPPPAPIEVAEASGSESGSGSGPGSGPGSEPQTRSESLTEEKTVSPRRETASEKRGRRARERTRPAVPPDAGPVAPEPVPPEPEPAPAPADAVVTLTMDGYCTVSAGGKPLGMANPKLSFSLPPGDHTVECARPNQGLRWSRRVTLAAGQRVSLSGQIQPRVRVTVALTVGDAARIRPPNRVLARGARTQLPVARYRVDILKDGKPIGFRHIDIRGPACTLVDQPEIACDPRQP